MNIPAATSRRYEAICTAVTQASKRRGCIFIKKNYVSGDSKTLALAIVLLRTDNLIPNAGIDIAVARSAGTKRFLRP